MTKKDYLRTVIYPKDVVMITGRSSSYSRKLIAYLKKTLGKTKSQYITISEFCNHTGISAQEVLNHLH